MALLLCRHHGPRQRDGINRLRHAKRYSGFHSTICVNPAYSGFAAGVGKIAGPDPREMAKSDLVVIWGTNAVSTQVNVMTHATRARKERGAKIAAVDVYMNGTMEQADLPVLIRPGTDGALACAVMHCLFRDGFADRDYLARYTDAPHELEAHVGPRPRLGVAHHRLPGRDHRGLRAPDRRAQARLLPARLRLFALAQRRRQHARGELHRGGDRRLAARRRRRLPQQRRHLPSRQERDRGHRSARSLDPHARPVAHRRDPDGDRDALAGGPPVTALLIQNTNPLSVAPDQERVKRGFARDDLFVCVHEQFMTDTAQAADIVLPATMFVEHDDFYTAGGSQYIMLGPKLIEPPGQCRSNHDVICALAKRLGAVHPGFAMTPRELIDVSLQQSGWGTLAELEKNRWIDCQPDFATAHYLDGFAYPDKKFHFKPDWPQVPFQRWHRDESRRPLPELPDHWDVIEEADAEHPFRLATSPARGFLNSTFTETPTSLARERRPEVMIHPDDAAPLAIADGDEVVLGNRRGQVHLHARLFDGVRRGVLIAESLWPNSAYADGRGINTLTGADSDRAVRRRGVPR